MKKILAILMAICLLAGALCITAFAANDVLTVRAIVKGEADPVLIGNYDNFEDGWNAAMEIAGDEDEMKQNGYERIVVDLYTDWKADSQHMFSDDFIGGDGFRSDTIYIPEGAKVTLNLNGHTIDRHLEHMRSDGEVIVIDCDADVIINNGTIKGGYGDTNDAGAIYIDDNAEVTLNNVNIVDNITTYDGAGIYVGFGSILTVNGGSFKNNGAIIGGRFWNSCGGAVCVEGGTAFFNGVEFTENIAPSGDSLGAAIYVEDGGKVVIENCTFDRNGIQTADEIAAKTVIHGEDSSITITNSTFTDNVGKDLFYMEDSILNITGGTITKTSGTNIFYIEDTQADIEGVTITDNACGVMTLENGNELVNMIGCILGNNTPTQTKAAFVIDEPNTLTMLDCTLGNTTFSDRQYVKITSSEVARDEAVIGVELLREDGTVDSARYYKDFAGGWDYATECAETGFFDRVVVSLYADWNTNAYGVVEIPANSKMTLNMNGHTINRGLGNNNELNGEVICIGGDAEVIINGGKSGDPIVAAGAEPGDIQMGTITGGNSDNGAGGIHVLGGAKLTLNNVHVDGNTADDDHGAGIALYNGASLVMRGGSLSNNRLVGTSLSADECLGGGLYVYGSTATLDNVELKNNQAYKHEGAGMAIYACESEVALSNCIIDGNGLQTDEERSYPGFNAVYVAASDLTATKTRFTNNGVDLFKSGEFDYLYSTVIGGKRSSNIRLDECVFENNNVSCIFFFTNCADSTRLNATNCEIVNNKSSVHSRTQGTLVFEKCTFNNNKSQDGDEAFETNGDQTIILRDCSMGDSDYSDKNDLIFEDANGKKSASIFGEGSLAMIVAILALVASGVSIFLFADMKKKLSPVAADSQETEDEE